MNKELEIIHWNSIKNKLKQKHPLLTNADLQWRNSSEKDLLSNIANKLGITIKKL